MSAYAARPVGCEVSWSGGGPPLPRPRRRERRRVEGAAVAATGCECGRGFERERAVGCGCGCALRDPFAERAAAGGAGFDLLAGRECVRDGAALGDDWASRYGESCGFRDKRRTEKTD